MKFRIVLEFDPAAGSFSATCPELPGCASAGDTEEEARRNIEEAIRLYLAPAEIELPRDAKLLEVTIGERGTPRLTADQVIAILNVTVSVWQAKRAVTRSGATLAMANK